MQKKKKVTTKDLEKLIEKDQVKETAGTKKAENTDENKKAAEEEIIFSEKHSMEDFVIGKQIGQGAYATVHIGLHKS